MRPFANPRKTGEGEQRPNAREISEEEREIDRVLADSFPASDSPPWTLGVAPVQTNDRRKPDAGPNRRRR
jgi:hypothetical protein